MISIEEQALQLFPELIAESQFEAAMPVFHLRLQTRVLREHRLSHMARFLLRAVSVGICSGHEAAEFFGLTEFDLAPAGAELLSAGLLEYAGRAENGTRPLQLTDAGREELTSQKRQFRPGRRLFRLQMNALTQELLDREKDVLSAGDAKSIGIFVLPTDSMDPPVIQDIHLTVVKDILLDQCMSEKNRVEIIDLIQLETTYVEYLRVAVVALRSHDGSTKRFAVFRDRIYDRRASDALLRLAEKGVDVLPADLEEPTDDSRAVLQALPKHAMAPAERFLRDQKMVDEIARTLSSKQLLLSTTQIDRERLARLSEIEELKQQLEARNEDLKQTRKELDSISNHTIRFLDTLEHRGVLENAIRKARHRLVIVSPWMNERTVDGDLRNLIRSALVRGVDVRICYGYRSTRIDEVERNNSNVRRVTRALERDLGKLYSKLQLIDMEAIHEKALICDSEYCVTGSFNWLSYRGEQDDGYRTERSVMIHDSTSVEELYRRIFENWQN